MFRFKKEDFDSLTDLPFYTNKKGNRADLPAGAIICMGYMVGTYIVTIKKESSFTVALSQHDAHSDIFPPSHETLGLTSNNILKMNCR
jgi:hypothetical protein